MIKLTKEDDGVRFEYRGLLSGNGRGEFITADEAERIFAAFVSKFSITKIALADIYDDGGFCRECEKFYCAKCWNASASGGGRCPTGHFKSLDPHWSPGD